MSTDTENSESTPEEDESAASADAVTNENPETNTGDIEVDTPEFQELSDAPTNNSPSDLDRFQDIKVNVSADLGRAEVPIQTLMNMGEGSVLELNRSIDSPVELVAQGVPLACGEVVVVNGCFAIRVTQVYENQKGS